MDERLRRLYRAAWEAPLTSDEWKAYEAAVRRTHVDPDVQFQEDLAKGGAIERALMWEMDFPRMSVTLRPQGGLITVASSAGYSMAHVRVWYPTLTNMLMDPDPGDVRMTIASGPYRLTDIAETLQDRFPMATIVSSSMARALEDRSMITSEDTADDLRKPRRREDVTKRERAQTIAMEGRPTNSWVG